MMTITLTVLTLIGMVFFPTWTLACVLFYFDHEVLGSITMVVAMLRLLS